jgi:ABC-type glutathione transport system ATPase component
VAAFIWGIGIRRLIDAIRRENGHGRRLPWRAAEPAAVVSAEDQVLVGIEHGRLGQALAALSPELRGALEATVLDGLTCAEAAVLLGVAEGTVKSRCHRARLALRAARADIRVDGLSRRYGATRALYEVDLTLERGIAGLLGPNGAGKTTLLSILATVNEPDAGRVSVFGLDPGMGPSGWRSAGGSATSPRSSGITGTSRSPGSWTTWRS